jgi:predicted PurR-regulated permease PerM
MNTLIKIPFMLDLLFTSKFDCYHLYIFYMGKVFNPIHFAFYLRYYCYQWFTFKFKLFPHALAVSVTVILFVSQLILAFISYQISDIASDFAEIRKNINLLQQIFKDT